MALVAASPEGYQEKGASSNRIVAIRKPGPIRSWPAGGFTCATRNCSWPTTSPLGKNDKQPPVRDAVGVLEEGGDGQLPRGPWHGQQFQAGLVREAVGFALVHFLGRPNQVFPGVLATTRAGRTWSKLPSSGCSIRPVYWQRLPSRSRMERAQSFGRLFGTLA